MVAELFAIGSLPPCEAIHLPWLAEQATGSTIFRLTPLVMRHFNLPLRGCSVRLDARHQAPAARNRAVEHDAHHEGALSVGCKPWLAAP
jgi:hypothetical protein